MRWKAFSVYTVCVVDWVSSVDWCAMTSRYTVHRRYYSNQTIMRNTQIRLWAVPPNKRKRGERREWRGRGRENSWLWIQNSYWKSPWSLEYWTVHDEWVWRVASRHQSIRTHQPHFCLVKTMNIILLKGTHWLAFDPWTVIEWWKLAWPLFSNDSTGLKLASSSELKIVCGTQCNIK